MEFHMLLFFFFFKYSHDLSTDLSKTLLFKASFLFKTSFLFQNLFPFFMQSHVFLCLYTIQVCEFYAPLSSFFYFFILFKFPIWTTIPIIKKTTKKIYFLIYSHSENKRLVKKSHVWDHYETHGIKNMDMSVVFVELAGGSGRWEKCARW